MLAENIQKAVTLGQRLVHVLVATADAEGLPHVAAAGRLSLASEERVAVSAWFCPGTVMNIQHNRRISLVIWDATTDIGYQLLGEVEHVTEESVMDGYAPEIENSAPSPQVERQLLVHVHSALAFSHAPHSDTPA